MAHEILDSGLPDNCGYILANIPVLYYNFVFWYFEQLHTHLYNGFIRNGLCEISRVSGLEWSSYLKLLSWNSLEEEICPGIVQNPFLIVMLILCFIFLSSYLLKKRLKAPFFDEKFIPEIFNILAFYLLLVIPLKNSYFFDLIRQYLLPLFSSCTVTADLLYFLMAVLAFYLCKYIIFRLKRRHEKLMAICNRIYSISRDIKSILIFSFVLCYCLGITFAVLDNFTIGLVILMIIAIQKSKTIYSKIKLSQKMLLYCRKLYGFIRDYVFLFCSHTVRRSFRYIAMFILLQFMFSALSFESGIILWIELVLDSIFTPEMNIYSISVKMVIFFDFINFSHGKAKENPNRR